MQVNFANSSDENEYISCLATWEIKKFVLFRTKTTLCFLNSISFSFLTYSFMLIDDQLIDKGQVQKHFPSILRQNVIEQAASMLLQHMTFNHDAYRAARNSNGNALDEYRFSLNSVQKKKKDFRRTNKCYSWLSKFPSIADESFHK